MSNTPIIRLAAWLWADGSCYHDREDKDFKEALKYFYEQHRSTRLPNWTRNWIARAQRAYVYMKEDG